MKKYSTDKNHKSICSDLRHLGYSLEDLSKAGAGFPDLLVANHHALTIAVELKTETGKIKTSQLRWMSRWKGYCGFARTTDEVVRMFDAPTIHCLTQSQKNRLVNAVENWEAKKRREISQKEVLEVMGKWKE